jgi:2-keto-3-deoxy-L-rhamnonate aldolase RhmA
MLDADKLTNPVRQRMQAGRVSLGMPVRLGRSGDIARIAKTTGHDFLFIDCQHSLFNIETIGHIASTAMACGVAPLARVRGIEDPDVSLLLDPLAAWSELLGAVSARCTGVRQNRHVIRGENRRDRRDR